MTFLKLRLTFSFLGLHSMESQFKMEFALLSKFHFLKKAKKFIRVWSETLNKKPALKSDSVSSGFQTAMTSKGPPSFWHDKKFANPSTSSLNLMSNTRRLVESIR